MPSDNNNQITCHFQLEKETKGAIRYMQVTDDGKAFGIEAGAQLGSVYIRKSAFKDGSVPQRLTMTIAPE